MARLNFSGFLLCLLVPFVAQAQLDSGYVRLDPFELPKVIAFGSCASEIDPQPIISQVAAAQPDLFIYLGDNIYGDTRNMNKLRKKYARLAEREEFQALKKTTPILAVWDDHDYGENDAGRHYPMKKESEQIFLDFWGEPAESERRQHEGIYHSVTLEGNEGSLQIIMLDTRYFRDNLVPCQEGPDCKNDYQPNTSPDSTLLGEAQWSWLEEKLAERATLRLICSSTQFGHSYNGWESWNNVPHERQRMLDLIRDTEANGVFFISGDVHWGEISRLETDGLYPIYDITSSGINKDWDKIEPNTHRVGDAVAEHHYATIEFDWKGRKMIFRIIDVSGNIRNEQEVPFGDLEF